MEKTLYSKYTSLAIAILLIYFGFHSVINSKVQLLPNVDPPRISFSVNWPGASKNLLLTQVIQPYEQSLKNKLDGLKSLEVSLAPERVTFQATFDFNTILDIAEQDIRMLLSRTRPLPLVVPAIQFIQGGNNVSNRVVGSYFITSSMNEFSTSQQQIIRRIAEKQIFNIPGIENVELHPRLERQLIFKIDPVKMDHFSMSYQKVRQVILNLFHEPTGTLFQGDEVIRVQYYASAQLADFEKTPIDFSGGTAIRLGDLGTVKVEPVRKNAVVRFNGEKAISMRVLRYADANLLELQKAVDSVLDKNKVLLDSAGLTFHLSFDTALFIERSISWVVGSILAGFLLSLLVSYLFLKRLSPTILGGIITILSVCGTLTVLNMLEISINVISLAGITFAIGMFVDGVLIVSEYLDRHGETKKRLLVKRVWELAPALTASVLTTVIVFSPLILNQEAEGKLFSGLAIAISSGLVISLLLALIISPIFAFYFMKPKQVVHKQNSRLLDILNSKTERPLIRVWILVYFTIGAAVVSVILFPSMSYLPSVKRDAIDVFVPLPGNNSIEFVEKVLVAPLAQDILEDKQLPVLKNSYALGWRNFATAALRLEDNEKLESALAHLKKVLPPNYPDNRVIVMQGNLFGGIENSNNILLQIFVSDQQWLASNIDKIRTLISDSVNDISVRFEPNLNNQNLTLVISPNRDNLRDIGVSENELKAMLQSVADTDYAGSWSYQGEALQAFIHIDDQSDLEEYKHIPFVTQQGVHTFLGELVNFESVKVLPSLKRIDGIPAITARIGVTDKKRSVSEVVTALEEKVLPALNRMIGDRGYLEIRGSAASLQKAKHFLFTMFIFSLMAFLIIVSLIYRSIKLSLYVILTLPAALAGGMIGFRLLNSVAAQNFDVLTLIGFMIMLGIVANNAILLIDAINKAYKEGSSLDESVKTGMLVRLRPVLVSTFTTVVGMLPLLVLPSEASSIYRGIAAVIVGGVVANLISVFSITAAAVKQFGLNRSEISRTSALIEDKAKYGVVA